MQFLCCKVQFLMIYAHMCGRLSARWLGSILRFLDFEILDFEIFALSLTRYGGSPHRAQVVTPIWTKYPKTSHATLLPKKEKSLNMPAPPPRPRPRRWCERSAESDGDGLRGPE